MNPYTAETSDYLADRNAISPNGDGLADCLATVQFALLRNAEELSVRIESENGKQVYYEDTQKNVYRSYYLSLIHIYTPDEECALLFSKRQCYVDREVA